MKKDYLSINNEPFYNPDDSNNKSGRHENSNRNESETARDSVFNEPSLNHTGTGETYIQWVLQKRSQCSKSANILYSVAAALLGGIFAIAGAFFSSRHTVFAIAYIILFGPVTEEILKQSGIIYLVEKKPYRLFSPLQFILIAICSAAIFSCIENILYTKLYYPPGKLSNYELFVLYRWTACMGMHIVASLIASFGMIKVWKAILNNGKPADLSNGYKFFAIAITLHGLFNAFAVFVADDWFK